MKTLTRPAPARFVHYADVPDTYTALCGRHLPRPIHSAAEQRAASALVESLAGFPLNRDQEDYLEAVAHFVDEYDRARTQPLPAPNGLAVLKHLLAEHGLNAADLSRLLRGSRNLGAMILRGERNLTLGHVRRLAAHFSVRAEVFI
jgi:antitoxin component HigA of HigAB toxin-antitoxin module